MVQKHVARMLGGYETTMYPTAIGDLWRIDTADGPAVKLLLKHGDYDPCAHYLSASEARNFSDALKELADTIDAGELLLAPHISPGTFDTREEAEAWFRGNQTGRAEP